MNRHGEVALPKKSTRKGVENSKSFKENDVIGHGIGMGKLVKSVEPSQPSVYRSIENFEDLGLVECRKEFSPNAGIKTTRREKVIKTTQKGQKVGEKLRDVKEIMMIDEYNLVESYENSHDVLICKGSKERLNQLKSELQNLENGKKYEVRSDDEGIKKLRR